MALKLDLFKFPVTLLLTLVFLYAEVSSSKDINFLIVLLDDASMSDFNILGSTTHTPNVDEFIKSSLYFPNTISGGVVCSPSRACVQTGRIPLREGILRAHDKLRTNAFTIADLVKSQGYETMYFGKWHLGVEKGLKVFGYDKSAVIADVVDEARLYNAVIERGFNVLDENGNTGNKEDFRNKFTDGVFIDYLIQNLERVKESNKPKNWLAMLGMITTHTYRNKFFVSPDSFQKCVSGEVCQELHKKSRFQLMYETAVYDFDQAFGRLINTLKRLEYYDNTMIFFTSDNGLEDRDIRNVVERYPFLSRPRRNAALGTSTGIFKGNTEDYYDGVKTNYIGSKRSLYSGGHRIGMAIRYPPLTAQAGVNLGNIFHADILPTIAEMLSIDLSQLSKDVIDGASILPALKRNTFIDRQKAIIVGCLASGFNKLRCGTQFSTVILGNYSLITSFDGGRRKLFNTYADPGQTKDIQRAHTDIVSKMAFEHSEFLKSLERSYLLESQRSDCRDSNHVQMRRPTYTPQGFKMVDTNSFINSQHFLPSSGADQVKNVLECYLKCLEDARECNGLGYDFRTGYRRFRCFLYPSSDIRTYTNRFHRRDQRFLAFFARESNPTPSPTPDPTLSPTSSPSGRTQICNCTYID